MGEPTTTEPTTTEPTTEPTTDPTTVSSLPFTDTDTPLLPRDTDTDTPLLPRDTDPSTDTNLVLSPLPSLFPWSDPSPRRPLSPRRLSPPPLGDSTDSTDSTTDLTDSLRSGELIKTQETF